MVNFHTSSRKSENLHFDGLFLSKAHKFLDEKVQETLCLMTLKSDAKFDRKLTLGSKSDMRNLVNFIANSGFKNLHFAVLLLLKRYYIWAKKKIQRSYCHNTQEWCTIWRGTDLCFEKWHEELYEFWKYQNLHFSGLFLTKVYNVWTKKVQKSYVWLYWRSMQTLKESDL